MEGLEIQDIHKRFEDLLVLEGISFTLARGEILAVLGPSGSGKTTLLEIIAGLVEPDRGDIRWNGESLLEVPTHQRSFGLMFQEYVLFPHKNVSQNVAFGLRMAGEDRSQIRDRVQEVLELVGLSGYGDRDVSTLSGGEQQRVALARSLAPEPRLVMLDEPLGALDRAIRDRLINELREILKAACQTVLYVTHDQEEAFSIADRIVILGSGRIAQIGTAREIYYQPASPYVAGFLGMNNFLPATARRVAAGSEIETPLGTWQVQTVYQGPGLALLRPDHFSLKPAHPQQTARLQGTLLGSGFSGSSQQIRIGIDDQELRFFPISADEELPAIGDRLEIWFSPDEALHFYPHPQSRS